MSRPGPSRGARVALLRGVNMGGHNKLPMKDLAARFTDAGCRDVRTYIQSGNVVFTPPPGKAEQVVGVVLDGVAARFGFRPAVVLRTAGELAAVVAGNSFLAQGADPAALHVLFLADTPDPARAAALDPDRSPPDAFAVRGREVYLWLPNGVARSRLTTAWFDRALGTKCTGRSWRTVVRLAEMAGG